MLFRSGRIRSCELGWIEMEVRRKNHRRRSTPPPPPPSNHRSNCCCSWSGCCSCTFVDLLAMMYVFEVVKEEQFCARAFDGGKKRGQILTWLLLCIVVSYLFLLILHPTADHKMMMCNNQSNFAALWHQRSRADIITIQ